MQQLIIPTKGAQWKHQILSKIAKSKEFPSRLRLYNLLKYVFNINLVKTSTQSGLVLLLDIADWVQYQIYFYGNYERKSINLFKILSNKAQVIFDIGAHVGQYALECAQLETNKNKHIFAIEANPKTFTYLLNNI